MKFPVGALLFEPTQSNYLIVEEQRWDDLFNDSYTVALCPQYVVRIWNVSAVRSKQDGTPFHADIVLYHEELSRCRRLA
jgi:hypothetical protein